MGIDNNTFVGVFVFVKPGTTRIEKTREIYVSASGKKHSKKIKFDPQDGSPVIAQKETYFENIIIDNWYDVFEYFNENKELIDLDEELFYCPEYAPETEDGYKIWIPNKEDDETSASLDEVDFSDISDVNPSELIEKFKKEFGPDLDKVRKYFEDIKICYGVINYQS